MSALDKINAQIREKMLESPDTETSASLQAVIRVLVEKNLCTKEIFQQYVNEAKEALVDLALAASTDDKKKVVEIAEKMKSWFEPKSVTVTG